MSDYEEEGFESLEEYQEQEDEDGFRDEDEDWSNSIDDMESDDWSEQFGRSSIELEEVEDHEDFGDDEVDDLDLERIERDYFDEDGGGSLKGRAAGRPAGPASVGAAGGTSGAGGSPGAGAAAQVDGSPNPGGGNAGDRGSPGQDSEGIGDRLIDRYVDLKTRLKEIQTELKELKPKVVEALAESGGIAQEATGTVRLAKRPKWSYSDDISRLEEMIRAKKKEERESGVAVVSAETSYLLVQPEGGQTAT